MLKEEFDMGYVELKIPEVQPSRDVQMALKFKKCYGYRFGNHWYTSGISNYRNKIKEIYVPQR